MNDIVIERYIAQSEEIVELSRTLEDSVDQCNLTLQDLDHYLELEDMTQEELRLLQNLRCLTLKERRRYKNKVAIIGQVTHRHANSATDRYKLAVRNLNGRRYSPRVVTLDKALGRDLMVS